MWSDSRKKILPWETALNIRRLLAGRALKAVFTNGCFDLLHPGHLRYLHEARAQGDFLFVGLNSDASVAALKGPARPICPQEVRAEMLAGLSVVDAVVVFDQPTPLALINHLRPDVLVKGGDWPLETLVGRREVESWGGRALTIALAEGFSTTSLINQIKERT